MWPVQDRPATLQDKRTVNGKDMATLQVIIINLVPTLLYPYNCYSDEFIQSLSVNFIQKFLVFK